MSEAMKVGSIVMAQVVKRVWPYVLTGFGGFVAASWPVYHAAFCQVN